MGCIFGCWRGYTHHAELIASACGSDISHVCTEAQQGVVEQQLATWSVGSFLRHSALLLGHHCTLPHKFADFAALSMSHHLTAEGGLVFPGEHCRVPSRRVQDVSI